MSEASTRSDFITVIILYIMKSDNMYVTPKETITLSLLIIY